MLRQARLGSCPPHWTHNVGIGAMGATKTMTFVVEYHAELPLVPNEGRRLLLP